MYEQRLRQSLQYPDADLGTHAGALASIQRRIERHRRRQSQAVHGGILAIMAAAVALVLALSG
jgi:hypothetical protein